MSSRIRQISVIRMLLLPLLPVAVVGCDRVRGLERFLTRRAALERQIEDLRQLVRVAEKGGLLPKDKLVVAVGERLANDLARLALPREQVVADRYRVRLEKADVQFRDEHGSVRFDGKVGPAEGKGAEFFAELTLFGAFDSVDFDRQSGVLRCDVSIVGFDLKRLEVYGDTEAGRFLVEELGRQGLDVLRVLAFPIVIPVRLEREIALKGVSEGPVRLQAASLPPRLTVTDVAAHDRRLWVAVDVASLPKRVPASSPSGSPERKEAEP